MRLFSLLLVACSPQLTAQSSGLASTPFARDAESGLSSPDTTVYILRHAEKADPNDWNTPLADPEGFARAELWAEILAPFEPAAVFTSNLQRTQQTLAVLTQTPLIRPALAPSPDRPNVKDTKALASEILAEHAGETVVVCWHTPLVRDLALALGASGVPEWDHDTYDHMWTVTRSASGLTTFTDEGF